MASLFDVEQDDTLAGLKVRSPIVHSLLMLGTIPTGWVLSPFLWVNATVATEPSSAMFL